VDVAVRGPRSLVRLFVTHAAISLVPVLLLGTVLGFSYRNEARRRGVATTLMSYVEQQAASKGIYEVVLDTWAENLEARRFFGSQGFAEFNVMLRKKLPEGS